MKRILKAFIMSISMYSIIPTPKCWEEKSYCWVLPFFPVVGAIIGGLWFGLSLLLTYFKLPLMLSAILLLIFPLFLSGFIHIDGYMDTSDAIGSRAELSKKRAILKDSHVGAFAVIAFVIYALVGFGSLYSLLEKKGLTLALILIPVLSRSMAGAMLLNVKLISENGFGAMFRQNKKAVHTIILILFSITCFIVGALIGGSNVIIPLLAVLFGSILATIYSVKQLDGISGDLCGFIITVSELCALITLAII